MLAKYLPCVTHCRAIRKVTVAISRSDALRCCDVTKNATTSEKFQHLFSVNDELKINLFLFNGSINIQTCLGS